MSSFLDTRNDDIDNAVFDAVQSVANETLEWNMELIGEVTDFIESILLKHSIKTCHPWYDDDESVCYSTRDRCDGCKVIDELSHDSFCKL